MSYGDATQESADESGETGGRSDSESDGGRAARLLGYVRKSVRSGALAGIGGGATVIRGIRAVRAGDTARGFRHLLVGVWLLAVAAVQRQSTRDAGKRIDIDQSDVVDTSPDLESVAGESESQPAYASGDEASSVVDTGTDLEGAIGGGGEAAGQTAEASESGPETDESAEEWAEEIESEAEEEATTESEAVEQSETDEQSQAAEETDESAEEWAEGVESEAEDVDEAETAGETDEAADEQVRIADDRLGAAAFDEHSNEVPAPQRAFNQEFLSMNAEAVWGIRDDDGVVVSQLFDPIQDDEDVQYVASTQVTEDRIVTIPDEILDHWEIVYDGIGVAGGDDIVFATGDELQDDEQLLVVPAAWADDLVSEDA